MKNDFIPLSSDKIAKYAKLRLFKKESDGRYTLFKLKGEPFNKKASQNLDLFLHIEDKADYISSRQKDYSGKIKSYFMAGDISVVRNELASIVSDTLDTPTDKTLKGLGDTVDSVIDEIVDSPAIMETLIDFSLNDYSTAFHIINVMAFTASYCFQNNYSIEKTKEYSTAALLHDAGKNSIIDNILKKPGALTDEEFTIMKSHAQNGGDLLQKAGFSEIIYRTALEHHEKLDGSGYPNGITDISIPAQLIGIIDCYEALTNHYRPYKKGMSSSETSEIIKKDVEKGKVSKELFQSFVMSRVKG